jgi:hypothetical protein
MSRLLTHHPNEYYACRNESGGARASTAAEFFQRFPSLFYVLLTELGNITGHTVVCKNAWPDAVKDQVCDPACEKIVAISPNPSCS